MDAKKVGKMIKVLRNRIGYTQNDLAIALGVTDKAVSKWERGISVPDIAIINQLSIILNCDVDKLLEGDMSFLEKTWQGVLIIDSNDSIELETMLYGKPMVYILLCYFVLAGISKIYIKCPKADKEYIENRLGSGSQYGLSIVLIEDTSILENVNAMVIYNTPFIYGPNLTKYFQRAMCRQNGISALTVCKGIGENEKAVIYDKKRILKMNEVGQTYCSNIFFVPAKYVVEFMNTSIEKMIENNLVYAEPMGNGMIAYSINTLEDIFHTAGFIRYFEIMMGMKIYELEEVARKRELI